MYKVLLDENGYFTGNYCTVGDVPNSVLAENLPNCDRKYYKAYKGIPVEKQIEEKYTEMVEMTETVEVSVLDDEGNDTGEVIEKERVYTVPEIKTRLVDVIVYEWEIDEEKKKEIDEYVPPELPKTDIELLQEQIASLQEQNDILTECLLEVSEVIYAE